MNKSVKTALIIGVIIVVVLTILPLALGAVSGWQHDGGWGMMGPGMMGFGGWWFMPIFFILFWGLVIWGIVALVRGLSGSKGSGPAPPTADSALDILKRRYARGELNKEEYEEKKKDLT